MDETPGTAPATVYGSDLDETRRRHWGRPEDVLERALEVLSTPRPDLLQRLSEVIGTLVPHEALAQMSRLCTYSPTVAHGPAGFAELVGGLELARLSELGAETLTAGHPWQGEARLVGRSRPVLVVAATPGGSAGAELVLVLADDRPVPPEALGLLQRLWDVLVAHLDHRATDSTPDTAARSRAAATARSRAISELSGAHNAALTAILAPLRSAALDDTAARRAATDLAVTALLDLRRAADLDQSLSEEPAEAAFARLTEELRPLLRHTLVRLDVAPAAEAERSVPNDVARAAREAVRAAVLVMLEQEEVGRLHVGWRFVDDTLRAVVRDDGPGLLPADVLAVHRTADRIAALGGRCAVEAVPGWGSTVTVELPLVLAEPPTAADPLEGLHPREREVLRELARGRRNRDIAEALHISESTVKFHVANILAKLGVSTRGEAAALAHRAGLQDAVPLHVAS
ncbi:LuxR C-terminal-related transcriptional regulator [Kitasatospora sp. NPDC101183]|uniref:LuxR C-terminal-related transcriptional regulator n=1 Tax=Kitasatospora sp. NPDC101183 TaxID=3364100 RepID=UPI0038215951